MPKHEPFANSGKESSNKFIAWKMWISREIRINRESKGYCLGMLSVLASLPEEYLHRIETAEISPSGVALDKISMALCIPRKTFDPPSDLTDE